MRCDNKNGTARSPCRCGTGMAAWTENCRLYDSEINMYEGTERADAVRSDAVVEAR